MNEVTILITLASVHFIALMSPGPDFALIVQNTTRYGRKTGLIIALGLSVGILCHSTLSLMGISLLVHQHPLLYTLIQWIGGSYLLYLGIQALRSLTVNSSANTPATIDRNLNNQSKKSHQPKNNHRQAFWKGFTTNILNPKAMIFFISLMSSLIPTTMSLHGKLLALVILFGLALFWFSTLAWLLSSSRMQQALYRRRRYIDGLCGLIFTGVGLLILSQPIIKLFH